MKSLNYRVCLSFTIFLISLLFLPRLTNAETLSISLPESKGQVQTHTITLPCLRTLQEITSDTGDVEILNVLKDQVTIKLTNGVPIRQDSYYDPYLYSKYVNKTETRSSYSFPDTIYYSDNEGYTGTLSKSGSVTSRVVSGYYYPGDSKYVSSTQIYRSDETPPSSMYYSSGGYYGYIYLTGYADAMAVDGDGTPLIEVTYGGYVYSSSYDTRVWEYSQNYTGYAYKGGTIYENIFKYNIRAIYEPNKEPISTNISDQVLTRGKNSDLHLSEYFSDPDGDNLSYTASVSKSNVVEVAVSNDNLVIIPKTPGSSTVTVSAKDEYGGTVSSSFLVTIENQDPYTENINNLHMVRNDSKDIDLSKYFIDDDNDFLTYNVSTSNSDIAEATEKDGKLTIKTRNTLGKATIEITANDGFGGIVSQSFDVIVENQKPNTVPISEQKLARNETKIIDLSNYFSDDDNDSLTYNISTSDSDIAEATEKDGKLTIKAKNTLGKATIEITADDGFGDVASQSFDILVDNIAPNAINIPNQTMNRNETQTIENIANYFSDKDGDSLSYSVVSSDPSIVEVSLENENLILHSKTSSGTVKIKVTADDGSGGKVDSEFEVVVINHAPVLTSKIDDQKMFKNDVMTFDLSGLFDDSDGDDLKFTASSEDNAVETSIKNNMLTIKPKKVGVYKVKVTAADSFGGIADFEFKVEGENRVPIAKTIDKQNMFRKETRKINLSDYFSDPDKDTLTYTVNSSDNSLLEVSENNGVLELKALSVFGDVTVTLTANDDSGGIVSQTFDVSIVNAKPTIQPIDIQTMYRSDTKIIELSNYLKDEDTDDTLTFSVTSSDDSIVEANEKDGKLTLHAKKLGEVDITVIAEDNNSDKATLTFKVKVNNRPSIVPVQPNKPDNQNNTQDKDTKGDPENNNTKEKTVVSEPDEQLKDDEPKNKDSDEIKGDEPKGKVSDKIKGENKSKGESKNKNGIQVPVNKKPKNISKPNISNVASKIKKTDSEKHKSWEKKTKEHNSKDNELEKSMITNQSKSSQKPNYLQTSTSNNKYSKSVRNNSNDNLSDRGENDDKKKIKTKSNFTISAQKSDIKNAQKNNTENGIKNQSFIFSVGIVILIIVTCLFTKRVLFRKNKEKM